MGAAWQWVRNKRQRTRPENLKEREHKTFCSVDDQNYAKVFQE